MSWSKSKKDVYELRVKVRERVSVGVRESRRECKEEKALNSMR